MTLSELSARVLEALVQLELISDTTVLSWWTGDSYQEGKAMTICQAQQYLEWLRQECEKDEQTSDVAADIASEKETTKN